MTPLWESLKPKTIGKATMKDAHAQISETNPEIIAWLEWYALMGVVDLVDEQPIDRFGLEDPLAEPTASRGREVQRQTGLTAGPKAGSKAPVGGSDEGPPSWVLDHDEPAGSALPAPASGMAMTSPPMLDLGGSAEDARALAASCESVEALEAALRGFDGCALKETAINLCFADGNPKAPIMLIGEAPGAQEDRQGKPFVGPSGQLLDRMLKTIGLDRSKVYITNVIYWRPPGNRTPTAAELAICQPFLERQIDLIKPKLLVFVGGIAARALLGVTQGVTKLRGRHFTYKSDKNVEIPSIVMFHPAYLLRQPAQKRFSWRDIIEINKTINNF